MTTFVKKHWPLLFSLGIFWATLLAVLNLSIRQNQGHLIYAIDDSYIHMSIAKNIAEYGVWGITRYDFSSSSSSLLWTLGLAMVYRLFGTNEIAPIAMNITIASALIATMYFILLKQSATGRQPAQGVSSGLDRERNTSFFRQLVICSVLISIIFAGPLPALVFSGMEHITHALITIGFVFITVKALLQTNKSAVLVIVLAPLVTAIRFEGLFLILTVSTLFVLRKQIFYALAVIGAGVLPIVVYGIISIRYHWHFLPNSILLKGSFPSFNSIADIVKLFGYAGLLRLEANPHVLWLAIISAIVWIYDYLSRKTIWSELGVINLIFIISMAFHMQFAITGWFYRYEAYIVILGMLVVAVSLHQVVPKHISLKLDRHLILPALPGIFVLMLIAYPFIIRGVNSLTEIPQATTNIFQQQYQMGLFLRTFYQGQSIAVNDVGAVNYLADVRTFDLWGLGTLEVADARLARTYGVTQMAALTRAQDVKIAIFYDALFKEYFAVPPNWIKVGEWHIANNVVCADDTVAFYAVDPAAAAGLKEHFDTFSARLPAEVGHVSAK